MNLLHAAWLLAGVMLVPVAIVCFALGYICCCVVSDMQIWYTSRDKGQAWYSRGR